MSFGTPASLASFINLFLYVLFRCHSAVFVLCTVERFGAQASFVFPGLTLLAIATPDEAEASLERLRKLQALSA